MRSKASKLIGMFCVVMAMILLVESAPMGYVAHADKTVDQMKDDLSDLKNEAAQLEDKIAQLRKDKAAKQELLNTLQQRVDNTQNQIDICNQHMAEIDAKIAEINLEITKLEDEMTASKELFKKRLRATYMSGGAFGDANFLMLLETEDFSDLLAKSEFTKVISQKDKALMDEINAKIDEVQKRKNQVEEQKAAQAKVKSELDSLRKSLSSQLYEAEEAMRNLQTSEDEAIRDLNDLEAEIERFEKEIEEALKDASGNTNLDFGAVEFQWPCPGFYNITSKFGYRVHPVTGEKGSFHGGTDIASRGIDNTPARAAAAGKVIVATYNGSYGNYVMVYHGRADNGSEYATLYAHMWSYCVKVGDYVEAGDKLGNIGSTGSSTAPHLHFEVRKDGVRVDAMNYF